MADRLSALLHHFPLDAGPVRPAGLPDALNAATDPPAGWLLMLLRGPLQVDPDDDAVHRRQVLQPALIWWPRPCGLRLTAMSERGATVLAAPVRLGDPALNPLLDAGGLPASILLPQREMPRPMAGLWAIAVGEFEAASHGHADALGRIAALLVLHLLRREIDTARGGTGLLAGLADASVGQALGAMLARPGHPWDLAGLADEAGLSRTRLAERFRAVVGRTPADALTDWRLRVARLHLRAGHSVRDTAEAVGYGSPNALSRAFVQRLGHPPGRWQRSGPDEA